MSQDHTVTDSASAKPEAKKKSKKRPREEHNEALPVKKHKKDRKDKREDKEKRHKKDTKEKKRKHVIEDVLPTQEAELGTGKAASLPSPFRLERSSLYVALSPVAYGNTLHGAIAEHISAHLLSYFPPLDGVLLAFENASLSPYPEAKKAEYKPLLGQSIDEYAVTYIWLNAEFLVLRPEPDAVVEGVVNLQNQSMLGLLCYNYFNASIERSLLPDDWQWVEDDIGGHYADGEGNKIEGRLSFRARDFDTTFSDGGIATISILGTLREEAS